MPTTPTQIRIPPALLAQIDRAAESEGLTRTAWLLKAAQSSLGEIASEPRPSRANGSTVLADAPPSYRCPNDCNPQWRPTSSTVKCDYCRSAVVPA
jgi:hypothetical protein